MSEKPLQSVLYESLAQQIEIYWAQFDREFRQLDVDASLAFLELVYSLSMDDGAPTAYDIRLSRSEPEALSPCDEPTLSEEEVAEDPSPEVAQIYHHIFDQMQEGIAALDVPYHITPAINTQIKLSSPLLFRPIVSARSITCCIKDNGSKGRRTCVKINGKWKCSCTGTC